MKTLLRTLLVAVLCMATGKAFAYDALIDGIYYNRISSTDLEVTNGDNQYRGTVIIPEQVTYNGRTFNVTSIGEYAFYGCTGLAAVTIPNNITSIGDYAFQGCKSLTYITIPRNVAIIGYRAFSSCSGLTSVYISDITAWCKISFLSQTSNPLLHAHHLYLNGKEIKDLVIPNNIDAINDYTFYGCSGLTTINIPNIVTAIGTSAFKECSGLTSITIPNSVTSIGSSAFSGCSGLTSVIISNSVTSIGESAFESCSSLTSFSIPNNVTEINNSMFSGCTGLTSITIPNSVTSIGDRVFYGCSSLTVVTMTNSVKTIGTEVFRSCTSLSSFVIPNSTTSIGDWAFSYCSSLKSLSIGNSVTSIGSGAFYNCKGLTSFTIPKSVTKICNNAFGWCTAIKELTLQDGNSSLSMGYNELGSERGLFYDCPLETLYLGRNLSYDSGHGYSAFHGKTSLTSITIGNNVTIVGGVSECTNITSIHCFAENPPSAQSDAFASSVYTWAELFVPMGCKDKYKRAKCWKNFYDIIEFDATAISDIKDKQMSSDDTYDLNGRKVTRPTQGIYIQNGKKMIVK